MLNDREQGRKLAQVLLLADSLRKGITDAGGTPAGHPARARDPRPAGEGLMALPKPPRKKWEDWIDRPWTPRARARRNIRFRRWLWKHGYLTPNFTRAEYRCHDSNHSEVWGVLKYRARQHCFQLERFRHAVGDVSMPILSGYRTKAYNDAIGGASLSRHVQGDAADFSTTTVNRVGRDRWFQVADVIFADGGVGDYPSGSAHLDSRGYRARWRSF